MKQTHVSGVTKYKQIGINIKKIRTQIIEGNKYRQTGTRKQNEKDTNAFNPYSLAPTILLRKLPCNQDLNNDLVSALRRVYIKHGRIIIIVSNLCDSSSNY